MAAAAIAMLLSIHLGAYSAVFTFSGAPSTVRASYTSKPLVQCGSGLPVAVRGVHFVVRFFPARSAPSLSKPTLAGAGALRGLAKTCDFESDLTWAIGLDRRRPYHLARHGARVTVTFG